MKRNRGGERDLDHIILAAIRGLDRARLEYPQVRAGLILMMDRTFDRARTRSSSTRRSRRPTRGIVGVDIAGPATRRRCATTTRAGRSSSGPRGRPGITFHIGEEGGETEGEIGEVVDRLRPDRIGHGILAAGQPDLIGLASRRRDRARDLPHLEPAHEGPSEARTPSVDCPRVRRPRHRLHDRNRRAGDDADLACGTARAARADQHARRLGARGGKRPRARRELRPALTGRPVARPDRPGCAGARGTRAGPSGSGSRQAHRRHPRRLRRSGPERSANTSSSEPLTSTEASGGCIATATSSFNASGFLKTRSSRLRSWIDPTMSVTDSADAVAHDREL